MKNIPARISLPPAPVLVFTVLTAFSLIPLIWPVKFPAAFWINQFINNLIWCSLYAFNSGVLVPRLLFKGRQALFILAAVLCLLAIFPLQKGVSNVLHLDQEMHRAFPEKKDDHGFIGQLITVIISLILLGVSTITKFAERIREDRANRQALESDRISSELSYLKSQINPHFFFNILHTIYALIETNKEKAKESVYTLSHMMRYILYDTGSNQTLLAKEIAMVDDYIQLMKLRIPENVQVIFEKPATTGQICIAPMLLLPLAENAFKHGVSNSSPSYVFINLKAGEHHIEVEVRNSLLPQQAGHTESSNGIGLANTKRRLDILYPNRHTFVIDRNQQQQEFLVNLKINLHDAELHRR